MPQKNELPQILAEAKTVQGVAFQLRRDPMGILDVPGLEDVVVCIHVGVPSKMACRRDGKQYLGTAVHGDIDVIPVQTPSHWEMYDENDMALLLSLPQKLVRSIAEESGLDASQIEIRNRFQIRDSELETLSWAMKREIESGCHSGRLYLDGLTLAMASRLVMQHSSLAKAPAERNEGLSGYRLKQVLGFIEDQITEDLSLQQIAAVAGVSPSHVRALFKTAMGISVHQYVIQRRVERAKTLLTQDGMSMAEIAAATGFAHQSHLARHMRRVLGVAPKVMKRMLAEASPEL